ncbi:unnamed protein product [Phaedon cochleariae]|uniref:CHK kinase-like domain-containing protein n=1 Tax=Phaedon cochleariae TaxID=80249 RepID=A0A9P0E0D2_PHACE|nr:unnamed protein product [Phaedon cochleariae]
MEDINGSGNGNAEPAFSEDISEAIKTKLNREHFLILKHKLEPLPIRTGLLGDHSILQVQILHEDGHSESFPFFIKYFPKMEACAMFAEGIGAFEKEMFVYKLFEEFRKSGINIINSVVPECYLAKSNKYFFLEDLTADGFHALDKHKVLESETLVILQSLAKIHASSIIYEEKIGKTLLEMFPENFAESFFNDREGFINEDGINASIKCVLNEIDIFDFPTKLSSGKNFRDVAEKVCHKIYDLVKPSEKFRNVLTHGDLWATNFLLKKGAEGSQCKFVDFQCGRYVPPAQDVMSLLHLTTSREFRKEHMYEVIGMYYSCLEKHLKGAGLVPDKLIPFAEFLDSCEEQKSFAIVQTAIYFPLVLVRSNDIEIYFSDVHLNKKVLFEDRTHLVLAHKDTDTFYAHRLRESIQDLKDFCEYI